MKDIHASAFRVGYADINLLKMPYGQWYIGRVINGVDSYLYKDLTIHSSTLNSNNSTEDAYFHTKQEAQATLDKYLKRCKEEVQTFLASLRIHDEDNTNANQEA